MNPAATPVPGGPKPATPAHGSEDEGPSTTVRIRPDVAALPAYVPGARPDAATAAQIAKLSSNELPYPPQDAVVEAITRAYEGEYANVHRGLHFLSNLATDNYERVRAIIARFLNAPHEDEVIFTTGTTEAINLVSYAWAAPRLQAGDEILLSVLEHHANIVPWHFLRERQGVVLRWVEREADGSLSADKVLAAVGPRMGLWSGRPRPPHEARGAIDCRRGVPLDILDLFLQSQFLLLEIGKDRRVGHWAL